MGKLRGGSMGKSRGTSMQHIDGIASCEDWHEIA